MEGITPARYITQLPRYRTPGICDITTHPSLDHVTSDTVAVKRCVKASPGDESDVQTDRLKRAIDDAEKALSVAQSSLKEIPTLPSAYPPHPIVSTMKWTAKRVLALGGAFALLYSLNYGTLWMRCVASVVFPGVIAWMSLMKGSLSPSGALASLLVGSGTFLAGFRSVAIVLSFFISSSLLTKFKDETKAKALADHKKGGQRDWIQVFSNGFCATIFAVAYTAMTKFGDLPLGTSGLSKWSSFLFGAVLGNYACACGDTWASELGVLSTSTPRLITTLRPVPKGTNGGVTPLGLSASLFGGLFVGLSCYLATLLCMIGQPLRPVMETQWPILVLGMAGGLVGSIVDSVLGATVQFSGYDTDLKKVVNRPSSDPERVHRINGVDILSNNQVNLLSGFVLSIVIGYATMHVFHPL